VILENGLVPPADVEKGESLVGHPVAALNPVAPPLANMTTMAEFGDLREVFLDPLGEAVLSCSGVS
jgi:hypothetical protein